MRHPIFFLTIPLISIILLTGCQTVQHKAYGYHQLDSILQDMVEDEKLRRTLLPQLEQAIARDSQPNFNILNTLKEHFDKHHNKEMAFKYLRQIAVHEKADDDDYVDLACRYWFAIGTEENKDLAVEWFQKAARMANGEARIILSEIYREGLHGHKDIEEAQYWEVRGLSTIHKRERNRYGLSNASIEYKAAEFLDYSDCDPFLENIRERYLQAAFKKKENDPQALMAFRDYKHKNEKARKKDTLHLLVKAAQLGHPEAHDDLGYYYSREKETDKAIYHLRKAAALSPFRFYGAEKLGCLLWEQKNTRAEAVFWFAYDSDSFAREEEIAQFMKHLNQLTPDERREFDLMYENWAYNGKLP